MIILVAKVLLNLDGAVRPYKPTHRLGYDERVCRLTIGVSPGRDAVTDALRHVWSITHRASQDWSGRRWHVDLRPMAQGDLVHLHDPETTEDWIYTWSHREGWSQMQMVVPWSDLLGIDGMVHFGTASAGIYKVGRGR